MKSLERHSSHRARFSACALLAIFFSLSALVSSVFAEDAPKTPDAATDTAKAAKAKLPFLDLLDMQGVATEIDAEFDNGKWTLVKIWQANCHVCGEQAPMISAAHDERDDFTVLGISLDGKKGLSLANRFVDRHEPTYPNFVGELAVIAINFQLLTEDGFRGTPTYLLFNPENELMAAQPGMISKEALFGFIDKNS